MRRSILSTALLVLPLLYLVPTTLAAAPDPKAPPRVTAKELTAAYVKDPVAAGKVYGDPYALREVIVEGIVDQVVDGKYGKIARLKGTGKVVVSCLLRKEDVDLVKPGEKVVIRGRCRGFFEKDNLVDINGGVVQKAP